MASRLDQLKVDALSAFKAKDFSKAYAKFNEAIAYFAEAGKPPPLGLLDNRAATCEQLGKYEAALGDANRMIQLETRNAKGYLRAGKVLRLMDRDKIALQVYEAGLAKVLKTDPMQKALMNMMEVTLADMKGTLTEDQASPVKEAEVASVGVDAVAVLPPEILLEVMRYLSTSDIVRLLRVSKTWAIIASHPSLYEKLDFTRGRKLVKARSLRSYISRAAGGIQEFVIPSLAASDSTILQLLAAKNGRLQKLCISNGPIAVGNFATGQLRHLRHLRQLILSCSMTARNVARIADLVPSLEELECGTVNDYEFTEWRGRADKLWRLKIAFEFDPNSTNAPRSCPSFLSVDSMKDAFPNLEELSIIGWRRPHNNTVSPIDISGFSSLRNVFLTGGGQVWPVLPPQVTSLSIPFVTAIDSAFSMGECSLEYLDISSSRVTEDNLVQILWRQGALVKLCARKLPLTSDRWLDAVRTQCPKLTALSVSGSHWVNDKTLEEIVTGMVSLQELDVTDCTNLTGIGIARLLQKHIGGLQKLILTGCHKVSDDVVEWARSKGITVENRYVSEGNSKGQKVRY